MLLRLLLLLMLVAVLLVLLMTLLALLALLSWLLLLLVLLILLWLNLSRVEVFALKMSAIIILHETMTKFLVYKIAIGITTPPLSLPLMTGVV